MNILQAIEDPNLFRPFLADRKGRLSTWSPWTTVLRAVYGLLPIPKDDRPTLRQCTGRLSKRLPPEGFSTALFLTGRRSGKSRIAAVIGAYEAALAGHEHKLAKGETGVVAVCAPNKKQSRIVKDYARAIFTTDLLQQEVVEETREGFQLRNGIRIEILTGDFRTIRGYTLVAAIVDEIAFFGLDEESKVKSDTELVAALEPGLATVGGKLIAITTPYARKGWCWKTYGRHFAQDSASALVVNCPSRVLNPTLPQSVVVKALAEDMAKAKSEYLGEWRDDVGEYLPRKVIEDLVVNGRTEMRPQEYTEYMAFCDVSGGRGDDAALAIAHREGRTVVLDFLKRYHPPFNPHEAVQDMVTELRRYRVRRVTGDNFAADFVSRAFEGSGIRYIKCDKPKSQLYVELLPRLCSREIELLDNEVLVNQLAGLERRTRSGGKDIVDHPPGGHDDLANAVAGAAVVAARPVLIVGGLDLEKGREHERV